MRALAMNSLQNTTYQPNNGPNEGYIPGTTFEQVQEFDALKNDYSDSHPIVTSLPQTGGEAVRRDGETECMCTGWFKREILSTPGFPSPIVHPPKIVYKVRAVEGRGLGVFATENIKAGDLILAERPLLIKRAADYAYGRSGLSQEEMLRASFVHLEKNMEYLCSRMSPEALKSFKSLYNSHQTDGSGPLTGILRTNGFGLGINDPTAQADDTTKGAYTCVGAVASRFNHNCSPSASYNFNVPSFSMEIHAVRPIAKGEEITVAYTTLAVPAATRQVDLKPYGFACSCPACKDPATSDKERARVLTCLLPKTSQGVKYAEEALAAYEATGLQDLPRYIELLRRVAQINRKKSNKTRADELESLADKVAVAQRGRKHEPPVQNYMFKSPEEVMKFIMERGDSNDRTNMMNAFMQAMNPGPSNSTKIMGPDGKEINVTYSDLVPRPSGL
ncbi:SET domain-containing protein [Peniophora sp. CONT]|nr:SET domain-containing protein [Peniophora sp. CONT]